MKALLLLVSSILLFSLTSQAQEKCGTMMLPQNTNYRTGQAEAFENWLAQKGLERQLKRANLRSTEEELTIPVVVHIIHNGESLGGSGNIPTGQILAQIDILNADFRRTNGDASNPFEEFLYFPDCL